jgi:phospholipase D1/2
MMKSALLFSSLIAATHAAHAPLLDASDWFLTQSEMDEATGGFDRTSLGIAVSTGKNHLTPFVTAEMYWKSLYADVEATSSGDFIYMTGWLTRNDTILLPQNEESAAISSVGEVWTRAISRNVTSLSLLWRNVLPPGLELEKEFRDAVSKAGADNDMGDRARVIIDGRAPLPSGSHHQKSIIVKRNGEAVGYVGGIDLAQERWDTPDHCCVQTPPCAACAGVQREPGYGETCPGWQDVHTQVRGPAVLDIEGNFVARWNDDEQPSNLSPVEECPPKIARLTPEEVSSNAGTHSIQLLRTYVCSYQKVCKHGCFSNNAPYGETSHRDGIVKAIGNAVNFIYIEDQYFVWEEQVHNALLAAVKRGVQLIVLTQVTRKHITQQFFRVAEANMLYVRDVANLFISVGAKRHSGL